MSPVRRFALVTLVAGSLVALNAAAAHAQACPGNPSGGTWLRQSVEEGSAPGAGGSSIALPALSPAWQTWLGTFAASRHASAVATRPADQRLRFAIVRRPAAGR